MDSLFDNIEHKAYDRKHPQVWGEFRRLTFQLIRRGFKHYGAKAILEAMRFHTAIQTGESPKLNNNHTAYYARKFMRRYPAHDGFFEIRERQLAIAQSAGGGNNSGE